MAVRAKKVRKYPRIRVFKCSVCGCSNPATKTKGHITAVGHVKHFYCYCCREITEQIQTA